MAFGEQIVQDGEWLYRNCFDTLQLPNGYFLSVTNVQEASTEQPEEWRKLYEMQFVPGPTFDQTGLGSIAARHILPDGTLKPEPTSRLLLNRSFFTKPTMRTVEAMPKVYLRTFSLLGIEPAMPLMKEQATAIKEGWLHKIRKYPTDVVPKALAASADTRG
jgi:hypothetical protein